MAWTPGPNGHPATSWRPPPPVLPPRGRSTAWTRLAGAALIILSLILAMLSRLAFTRYLPAGIDNYRKYQAAERCPAHLAAPQRADCVRTLVFTVKSTEIKHEGKTHIHRANLHRPPSPNTTVSFDGGKPLLVTLSPGDKVTATLWHSDITELNRSGVRQETSQAPRNDPQLTAAMGTFAGLLAALLFWFGAVRLVRPRSLAPFIWRPYGFTLLITMFAICLAAGLATERSWMPWQAVAPLCAAITGALAGLLYWQSRPAATSGQEFGPAPPRW